MNSKIENGECKMKIDFPIDIVIPWVDGSDLTWNKEKEKYMKDIKKNEGNGNSRYRDWGTLRYWFRSIEKNVPWINKVHFVTCGQIPEWLNIKNSKLHFVKHEDYIPKEYLPTFSCNPIELNIHRISGLSEHFIYMNDDTFIMEPLERRFYFSDEGLPKQMLKVMCVDNYAPETDFVYINYNDMGLINRNFSVNDFPKSKLFHYSYGIKNNIKNLVLPLSYVFPGFCQFHMPAPFLKSTFEEVWEKEYEYLQNVSKNKFRNYKDVNQWLMQYWQLASAKFEPANIEKYCKMFEIGRDDIEICDAMEKHRFKVICINDSDGQIDFESEKEKIIELFDMLYPNKSSYELW